MFVRNGNKMILKLKVLSEMQARSIWQTFDVSFITFPVINPQVFQVYRRNDHTTKPAMFKKTKKKKENN